jgi:parvulin-like peptidyl-prolyl isomerase
MIACGPGDGDDAVATVDGASVPLKVLRAAVDERLQENPAADRDELINEELNLLVLDQIVLNRAAQVGIEVLDEELDARLRDVHGTDFTGGEVMRERARREMTIERTALLELGDRVRVPEATMQLYFDENRERFSIPERVEIRQIVVRKREVADGLQARLGEGADFAQLAAEHSLAPEAGDGGLLPPFARGDMPEAFDLAFDLKPDQVSEVIESPYGFHLFELQKRLPASEPEYADVRERIMLELERERLEDLRRDWLRSLRRSAEIQVNERLLETLR